MFRLNKHSRPFPNTPAELNPATLACDFPPHAIEAIVRHASRIRLDREEDWRRVGVNADKALAPEPK
jgi:hypothetical protein